MSGRNRFITQAGVVHVVERRVWMQSVEPTHVYRTICGKKFASSDDSQYVGQPAGAPFVLHTFFTWRTDNKRSAITDYSKHEHHSWTNKPWWRVAGGYARTGQPATEVKGCSGCLRPKARKE
jgi:hypothetical protein